MNVVTIGTQLTDVASLNVIFGTQLIRSPRAPLIYFNDEGGGGGGGSPSDFFGSEILAKSFFCVSRKINRGIFWAAKKRSDIFG